MAARSVRDLMNREVATLDRNDNLKVAKEIMDMKRLRHFPVVDDGEVVGVLSQRDLFHACLGSVLRHGEKAENAFLATVVVKEVMSRPPVTIAPGASVRDAASLMLERRIGCLPVVEEGRLVGMLTETDLLRELVSLQPAPART